MVNATKYQVRALIMRHACRLVKMAKTPAEMAAAMSDGVYLYSLKSPSSDSADREIIPCVVDIISSIVFCVLGW